MRQTCILSYFLKKISANFINPSPTFANGCKRVLFHYLKKILLKFHLILHTYFPEEKGPKIDYLARKASVSCEKMAEFIKMYIILYSIPNDKNGTH